ncbi:hypothetical protein Tco_0961935 [Tanacetum coccineum]
MKTSKPLLKDAEAEDVDVHLYRLMIESLMYLTAFRPDIMFVYPKDSPFDLEAYSDSDYAGASLDRKSTTGGCQFLRSRLISWQCKKQTVVANSTTEAEYVAAASCCGQVLWIQNQMLDYGYNFMNTKIFIDNESTICIVKNPIFHSKTKHIEIRHHFIQDSNGKKLIQMIKIHTDQNVRDLLTKAFDVDFLNANPIRYALTVSPTIYVSYIEQFWSTTKTKTVNNETQIRAKVDGNAIVMSESFMKRDLQFNDEDGTVTPLFATMLIQPQAVEGKGSGQSSESQHTPTTASPSHVEPIPISSGPTIIVADETVHEERRDSMERAATTAAILDAGQDSGNIIRTQSMATLNEPIPQGTGLGSGPRRQDIILGDRPAQTRKYERCSSFGNLKVKEKSSKVKKNKKSRTSQLKRRLFKVRIESSAEKSLEDSETQGSAPITTAGVYVSTVEPSTPPPTTTLLEDEDLTIAQTLVKMRSEKSKVKSKEKSKEKGVSSETAIRSTRGVIIQEASDTASRLIVPSQTLDSNKRQGKIYYEELQAELKKEEERVARQREEEANLISWDNTQAMMEADYELAQRLQAEEQGELTIKERSKRFVKLMDKRKRHFVKLRAEEIRRKPPTKAQKRNQMCTYLKNMANYKHKMVEGTKRQAEGKKAELKACLEIVPKDDKAVNVESLATKYPIVDWKTHIPAEDKMYYEIIRADGSAKYYRIFSAMLDDFDRQDVLYLYRLVKERFKTTSPKGYDILLWGDLITLFEPSEEDEIWKTQQDYTLISWRLFDSCGVHLLLMDTGIAIHMLVEKNYLLT